MKDYGLLGKVTIVTGAGRGIGLATAKAFAAEGAKVILADVDDANGASAMAEIKAAGGEARFVRCDVSDAASVDALMIATLSAYGRLDCAVNNAAIDIERALLADVDDALAERVQAINFLGAFLCMKRQVKQMLAQGGGGTIVNLASISAQRPHITGSFYSGTKAGVIAMSKGAAVTYAPQGIRINLVAPGGIDTPMMSESLTVLGLPPESLIPDISLSGRLGRPEEIAEAVLWLSSDLASFTFGHVLAVDGGYLSR